MNPKISDIFIKEPERGQKEKDLLFLCTMFFEDNFCIDGIKIYKTPATPCKGARYQNKFPKDWKFVNWNWRMYCEDSIMAAVVEKESKTESTIYKSLERYFSEGFDEWCKNNSKN